MSDTRHPCEDVHRALETIDPPAEGFEPIRVDRPRLRIYALGGDRMLLAWFRDRQNDWRSEFDKGVPPRSLSGLQLKFADLGIPPELKSVTVDVYDPWQDQWTRAPRSEAGMTLPDFRRSLVARVHN